MAVRPPSGGHAHFAEAAVHIEHLAGDGVGQIRGQEGGGAAHIGGADVAVQGGVVFHQGKNILEAGYGRGRQGFDGAGADGVDTHALGAQVVGQTEASSADLATPMTL